jgi:hypothetical protein
MIDTRIRGLGHYFVSALKFLIENDLAPCHQNALKLKVKLSMQWYKTHKVY